MTTVFLLSNNVKHGYIIKCVFYLNNVKINNNCTSALSKTLTAKNFFN